MKLALLMMLLAVFQSAAAPAGTTDDVGIARLATCQDSWLDWKTSDPAKLQAFAGQFRSRFSHQGNDAFAVPNASTSVMGLPVAQVFPDSIGMGVGFSVTVDAPFDKARAAVEKALGKSLGKCEASDGMRSCELEIAEQRTVTVMAEDDAKSTKTLVGCYYLYEK